MAVSGLHNGWRWDPANSRLDMYYRGTRVGSLDVNSYDLIMATNVTGGIAAVTGNLTATAGDLRVTAGNARLGAVSTFATTEPISAVVMKTGTAPSGAVTTSGGIFTDGTTVKKIIADGTVSDVQT